MTSQIVSPAEMDQAIATLRAGELLAFPTETVYGLGADASNPDAVRKIFKLKGRPSSHPVIVHIQDVTQLSRWARDVSPMAMKLAAAFWPGPFTLVLKRAPQVSEVLTGGQDTIAIRVPRHPIAQQLLAAFGGGIAAPSANRFGHVSPTLASHVRDEFGDSLLVLDGADCEIGLESTIVSCVMDIPQLLRPGGITLSQLRAVVPAVSGVVTQDAPRAPGMLDKHYSPDTPIHLIHSEDLRQVADDYRRKGQQIAVLAMQPSINTNNFTSWINAGDNPLAYGHSLYANLRQMDKLGTMAILIEQVPGDESWQAVRDRLQRAAAK